MRQRGMDPAKSTAGVTAVQTGTWETLWTFITILGHSLWLHIGGPVIVILNNDEVVACCSKYNKRVESGREGYNKRDE